jgi:hypothetical protein
MASGCIVGDCYICGDQVYEDELAWVGDNMRHYTCKGNRTLFQENQALRRELEDYWKWISGREEG